MPGVHNNYYRVVLFCSAHLILFCSFNIILLSTLQVFYVGGAIIGGYLSATLSGSLGSSLGVSPVSAFVGGACLLFGARLASGCTT